MEQAGINGGSQIFPSLPAGYALRSVAGGVDVVLASNEGASDIIELTGVLTANIAVTIPTPIIPQVVGTTSLTFQLAPSWLKLLRNSTSGGFTLTVKGPGGTGVILAPGAAQWCYSPDGINVQLGSAPGGGGGGSLIQFPNRLDLSVNDAYVDNAQSGSPVLYTSTGHNLAGAYNGGGTGNKAFLGIRGFDGMPLSGLVSLNFIWRDLIGDPVTLGLLPYVNLIVEPDPIGSPGVFRVFVITLALVPTSVNAFTATALGGGRFLYSYVAAANTIQVVNAIPNAISVFPGVPPVPPGPVVLPVVNNGPSWFDQAFRMVDILAGFPNARLRDASSLDGGLPKATVTPSILFILGDSNNVLYNSRLIEQINLNGLPV